MGHDNSGANYDSAIATVLLVVAVVYGTFVFKGGFDNNVEMDSAGQVSDSAHSEHDEASSHDSELAGSGVPHDEGHGDGHDASEHELPSVYAVLPFVLLLGAIAVFPLLKRVEHWWESNLHRFYVAAGLAIVTLGYYLLARGGWHSVEHVLEHAILKEFIPFIVLLFSLYAISGGIRIRGDLPATPVINCIFLAIGGALASFIGTTGAAMLLIRPLIDTNNERKHCQHTIVFFIFVVCNCGGCLLPIGDPPLFLGYLEGVPFLWTMWSLWLPWLFTNVLLIAIYFVVDKFYYYPKETLLDIRRDNTETRPLKISGLLPNAILLLGVILAVALLDPTKPINGWAPWPYLREIVQLSLVAASLLLGSAKVRADNKFNYHAILEVAALFIGIFICMQPALEILNVKGASLGVDTPTKYFWVTGSLSSVLDNAPTYLVFYKTCDAGFSEPLHSLVQTPGVATQNLVSISLGAVFMGAMTYIGNGPNFMVRAIAEQMGIRMPGFFGYVVRYSVPCLLPVFVLVTLVFLRT
ncbi:MAG: sodium:proton antiporter [Planctomycetales bacterium]|nr:sodium:proton antiporter [Planctomycetales bacterium]